MRWQSKEHSEKKRDPDESGSAGNADQERNGRIEKLKAELNDLAGGEAKFWASPDCPADVEEANLEDILEFESVGSGISLFEGLQLHGTDLPHPDKMNEFQSERKVMEVLYALEDLQIFLIGFDAMTGRELYSTLWHRTLWEGCYIRKRHPGAITLIDVSHKMSQSDLLQFLENFTKAETIQ